MLCEEVMFSLVHVVERPWAARALIKYFWRVVTVNEHVSEDLFRPVMLDNVELHRTGSDDARAASETVFLAVEVSSVDGKVNLLRESARTNRASENGGAVVLNHSVRLEMTIQPSSAFKNSGKGIRYLVRKVVQSVLNALNILFNMLYL